MRSEISQASTGRKPKARRYLYGAWLLLLRKEKGLAQADVSKRTGIPRTTLMYWERSGNLVGRKQILKLAKLYGVSVPKLLRLEKTVKTKFWIGQIFAPPAPSKRFYSADSVLGKWRRNYFAGLLVADA